jgi:hypothetical protein
VRPVAPRVWRADGGLAPSPRCAPLRRRPVARASWTVLRGTSRCSSSNSASVQPARIRRSVRPSAAARTATLPVSVSAS